HRTAAAAPAPYAPADTAAAPATSASPSARRTPASRTTPTSRHPDPPPTRPRAAAVPVPHPPDPRDAHTARRTDHSRRGGYVGDLSSHPPLHLPCIMLPRSNTPPQ